MLKPEDKQAAANVLDKATLAEKYMPYVRSIAGKIKKTLAKQIDFDDLVEYGMIGLLEAAERYDPSVGASFMTFAYYRIRGAIYDGLRGMGWLNRSEYARARFEERANALLAEAVIDDAVPHTKAEPVEESMRGLAHVVQHLAVVYITTLDSVHASQLKDNNVMQPDEQVGLDEVCDLVCKTIKKLSEQEQQLVNMYYYQDMSLQQIGEKLGLSKSWTSRLHARVIDKMHRILEESFEN